MLQSFALQIVGSDDVAGVEKSRINYVPEAQQPAILRAFSHALEAAQAYEGATAPNPPVGCVLLDVAGRELAVGAHRGVGQPHAEVEAVAGARAMGAADRIASFVVTLEPCNHYGRTPPCVETVLATGAHNVWIACRDPNTAVVGGGVERLRSSGIMVRFLSELNHPSASSLLAEAQRLIAPFAKRARTGLPFVTFKQAISSAGGMVPPGGRKTFTSLASLKLAHMLRRRADAILTGSGTVLSDKPLFTVRHVPDHPNKRRTLIIMDRRKRVSSSYMAAARQRGFAVHIADDFLAVLKEIGAAGGMEVLVEAGPILAAHVHAMGLWDEHVLIEQAGNSNGADRVTIHSNSVALSDIAGKEGDVHRHR